MNTFQRLFVAGVGVMLLAVAACGDDTEGNTNPKLEAGVDADVTESEASVPDAAGDGTTVPQPLLTGPVDRAGRAALIRLLITETAKNEAGAPVASKDGFNRLDVFTGVLSSGYLADFQKNLVSLDTMDGVDDWDGGSPQGSVIQVPVDAGPDADGGTAPQVIYTHPLVASLRTDVLLVDPTKPFSPTGYLAIERATLVSGAPGTHDSCGGRWLADDAVDKMLSFVVKRSAAGVSDGVAKATKDPTEVFPYLAPPN